MTASFALPHEIAALIVDYHGALRVEALGMPGDNPIIGTALGLTAGHHHAFRVNSLADNDRPMISELIDAQERTAAFAEIFDGQSENGVEQQQRADDQIGVAMRLRVIEVGVKRIV